MRFIQTIIIFFMLFALANCATMEPVELPPEPDIEESPPGPLPPSTRPAYNLSGYPAAMKDGYIDGCETAKETLYGQKNESRYNTDGQYRMGWDDGFDMCQDKTK